MAENQQPKDMAPIFNDERMAAWTDEHLVDAYEALQREKAGAGGDHGGEAARALSAGRARPEPRPEPRLKRTQKGG